MARKLSPGKSKGYRATLTGEEFLRKIADGERDFAGIRLDFGRGPAGSCDFRHIYECIQELNPGYAYLSTNEPVDISQAEVHNFVVSNLALPYLLAIQASFQGEIIFAGSVMASANFSYATFKPKASLEIRRSNFSGVNFNCAFFGGVNYFDYTSFMGASFVNAQFSTATFKSSSLHNSNFSKALLSRTYFEDSDLRRMAGLDQIDLKSVSFGGNNKIGKKDRDYILQSIGDRWFTVDGQ